MCGCGGMGVRFRLTSDVDSDARGLWRKGGKMKVRVGVLLVS